MYMFYYLSLALFSGLISVYLMDKGYSASQVSLVVSVQYALCMISQPFIGSLSDRFNRKKVNMILLTAGAFTGILFVFSESFWMLTAVYGITMALVNGVNPVIEQMATTSRFRYGSIRIWGTVGYAAGSQAAGLIYRYISPEAMYIYFSLGILICTLGLYGTREVRKAQPASIEKTQGSGILNSRPFLYYLLLTALFYGTTNVSTTYLPAMYQSQGLSVDVTSTLLFLGTMMELPVILFSARYMNRIGNRELLMAVFVLLIIQYGVYAFVPGVWMKAAATVLTKSVATMVFIMINLKVISTIINSRHQITALAVVSTFKSLVSIGFQSVSGYLLDHVSYSVFYMILFVLAAAGLIFSSIYRIESGNDMKLF